VVKRNIIEIDRDKCDGCGICTTACAEGALIIDEENKAKLVKEIYCDGLGACLDVCPTGALQVIEREAEEYSAKETFEHVKQSHGEEAAKNVHGADKIVEDKPKLACGCPGQMAREIKRPEASAETSNVSVNTSELSQWPVQLRLVSPAAPYFEGCDLLIAADCTAFSFGAFHSNFLKGKKLVIACPKLDDTSTYVQKLAEIIKGNTIYSVTVAIMSVPCCAGLNTLVQRAVEASGKTLAVKKIVIDVDGGIVGD
jgi:ferredoxin